jgi:hypothetical protein
VNRKIALLFPLVLAMVPAALAQDGYHVTAPSTWKMDAAKSDMGGDPNAPKADSFRVTKDTDKWLTYSETTVGADGKTMHMTYSAPLDGKLHLVAGSGGEKCANSVGGKANCTWTNGTTMDQQLEPLAMDAKTATFNMTVKTKDGKEYHEKMVYNRQ